jgi:proteic killer suppression protein
MEMEEVPRHSVFQGETPLGPSLPRDMAFQRITIYVINVIQSYANEATRDVYDATRSKAASKVCPPTLWGIARRKLDQLNWAEVLEDLRAPPGNRLEKLRGDRKGQHSIRINDQFRVCFEWTDRGPVDVEIVDYHG